MSSLEVSIRSMEERDLPGVAQIEAGVFTDWYRTYRRETEALAERTLQELRYATSIDPQGNFVAVTLDGATAGFIFSRTWGSVGWFGTFGVPTQFQGLGVGKKLVARTVEHLRSRADVVGLETMPESGSNIGLYTRAGFALGHPTVILELSLIHEAERLRGAPSCDVVVWNGEDTWSRRRLLSGMREVSDAVWPGLDYSAEIMAYRGHEIGETLVSLGRGGQVAGFAVLRTAPFREHDTSGRAYVHILAVRPGDDEQAVLDDLLGQVWVRATRVGFSTVYTGVNGQHHEALRLLLSRGFKTRRAAIRMIERGAPGPAFLPQSAIHCSRWAG